MRQLRASPTLLMLFFETAIRDEALLETEADTAALDTLGKENEDAKQESKGELTSPPSGTGTVMPFLFLVCEWTFYEYKPKYNQAKFELASKN